MMNKLTCKLIAHKLGVRNLTGDPLKDRAIILLAIDHLRSAYEDAQYWADESYWSAERAYTRAAEAERAQRDAEEARQRAEYELWDTQDELKKCNRASVWGSWY